MISILETACVRSNRRVHLLGGTTTANGCLNSTLLVLEGGSLTGTNVVHVIEEFHWITGLLYNSITLHTYSLSYVGDAAFSPKIIRNCIWINVGTVIWFNSNIQCEETATIQNRNTGRIEFNSTQVDVSLLNGNANQQCTLDNQGTLEVTGNRKITLYVYVINVGLISIPSTGSIHLYGSSNTDNGGIWRTHANATIDLITGVYIFAPSALVEGDGTIIVRTVTLNISNTWNLTSGMVNIVDNAIVYIHTSTVIINPFAPFNIYQSTVIFLTPTIIDFEYQISHFVQYDGQVIIEPQGNYLYLYLSPLLSIRLTNITFSSSSYQPA